MSYDLTKDSARIDALIKYGPKATEIIDFYERRISEYNKSSYSFKAETLRMSAIIAIVFVAIIIIDRLFL